MSADKISWWSRLYARHGLSGPAAGVLLVFFLLVPLLPGEFWTIVSTEILILGLFAMSFNLLYGYMGQISFGHGAFFGLGAYATAILFTRFKSAGGEIAMADFFLSLAAGPPVAALGVGYVPDGRLIFPDLTVRENLEIGIKPGAAGAPAPWTVARIYELFPVLQPLNSRLGGYLSGGEQQMLTIGRTLMGNPSLLLLDEPVEGVAPVVVQELTRQIKALKAMGLTILFAEQNMHFATEMSDRAYVIEKGRIRFQGTMRELAANEEIKQKYLMI